MIKTKNLNTYLNNYMADKTNTKQLQPLTIQKQSYHIQKFITYLKENNIEQLDENNTLRTLKNYRNYCLDTKNNRDTTVKTYLMSILGFLNDIEVNKALGNPTLKLKTIIDIKPDNLESEKVRIQKIALTSKQAQYFIETIGENNPRDLAITSVFLETGIRLTELTKLNKKDIKAEINEKGFYIIPEDKKVIDICLNKQITKGQKDRTVFITTDTLELLNKMINARIHKLRKNTKGIYRPVLQRNKAKAEKTRKELFTNQTGTRIATRTVQDMIKKYAKQTDQRIKKEGIKCPIKYSDISVHILRHTALSLLANDKDNPMPIPIVQEIAGHSTSTTTDKYIHPNHEIARKQFTKIMKTRKNEF